jgi:hypothetical protein
MEKYILIQKFGTHSEVEHNSRKNCEKSLIFFKVFVNIAFHIQFLRKIFPDLSFLVVDDPI